MKTWILALFLGLMVPNLVSAQTSANESWQKALKAASKTLPDLANPESDLSKRTDELRAQFAVSTNPVHKQAIEEDAALFIATEAAAQLDQTKSAKAVTEEQLKGLWSRTGNQVVAKYPAAENPENSLGLFAVAVVNEWLASQDPRLQTEEAFFHVFAEATKLNNKYEEKLVEEARNQTGVTGAGGAIKSVSYLLSSQAETDRLTAEAAKMEKDIAKLASELQKPTFVSRDMRIDWEATARNRGRDATIAILQKFSILLKEKHQLDLPPDTWSTDEKKYKAAAVIFEAEDKGELTKCAAEFAENFNRLMGKP